MAQTLRLRQALYVLLVTYTAFGETGAGETFSKQHAVAFLTETVDWYRDATVQQQIANGPQDILFLEDNRAIGLQVLRLSFDFAKAAIAFEATVHPTVSHGSARPSVESDPTLKRLRELETQSDSEAFQTRDLIKTLKSRLQKSWGRDRQKLQREISSEESRLGLLDAISANYRSVLSAIRSASGNKGQLGDLQTYVDDLERTVPELSSTPAAPLAPPFRAAVQASAARKDPLGLVEQISEVSALSRKNRVLAGSIESTDRFLRLSLTFQTQLTAPVEDALNTGPAASDLTRSQDLGGLQVQDDSLEALAGRLAALSPAVAAVAKQSVLLRLYRSHLAEWRNSVQTEYTTARRRLAIRVATILAIIVVLLAAGWISRRIIVHHLQDANSQRAVLAGQRIIVWSAGVLVVALAVTLDFGSFGTFLGLIAAGIAVALQNVIVAAVGYLVLVGKLRIRVGDRIEISGVTGEVAEIGLLQFQLKESDVTGERTTGRVDTFSNSFVFVSPATGLFKLPAARGAY